MQITLKQLLGHEPLSKKDPFSPELIKFYNVTKNDDFDDLPGLFHEKCSTWIYPNNLPTRKYQLDIVSQALFRNTLVCLPTGLGKTFIAAVIILNFLRWYPSKKVVFMAPTKPLVAQQREACLKFTSISLNEIVELTGNIPCQRRKTFWESKRLFFLTPQVLMNDLQSDTCPGTELCCLVFDEAHKATGNYAYCEIIRTLTSEEKYNHRQFRVLALTASPSSTIDGLQEVICNLLISHFEFRSNNSPDIKEYNHSKEFEKVIVPLSEDLVEFKKEFIEIAQENLRELSKVGIIFHSLHQIETLSAFKVMKSRGELAKIQNNITNFDELSIRINILEFICRSLEYLIKHGLRCAYNYMTNVINGTKGSNKLTHDVNASQEMRHLYNKIVVFFSSPSEELSQTQSVKTHPKLEKLREIVVDFFREKGETAKIIIFSQFRDSVEEIISILKKKGPIVRPASFIGQAAKLSSSNNPLSDSLAENTVTSTKKGSTQKDQIRIMEAFREGIFNTLVSTSIGEEGIDIGQVDLIICFDSSKSPIRLIQRSGRTGRMREGRVIFLLSEGKEVANFESGIALSNTINESLLNKKTLDLLSFYPDNPRMIPLKYEPKLEMVTIENNLDLENQQEKRPKITKNSLKSLQEARQYTSTQPCNTGLGSLLSLGEQNPSRITFTDWRPITTSQPALRRLRENFQSAKTEYGPSMSSINLVAILRMSYLVRKKISSHHVYTNGIRNIEISKNFSELIENPFDETAMTQTQSQEINTYLKRKSIKMEVPLSQNKFDFIPGPVTQFLFPTEETIKEAKNYYLDFNKCSIESVLGLLDGILEERTRRSSLQSGSSSTKTSTPINKSTLNNNNSTIDITFTEAKQENSNKECMPENEVNADTMPISNFDSTSKSRFEENGSKKLLESFQFGAIDEARVKDTLELFENDDLFTETIVQDADDSQPSTRNDTVMNQREKSFSHLFKEISITESKILNLNESVELMNEDWESKIQKDSFTPSPKENRIPTFFDDDEDDLFNATDSTTNCERISTILNASNIKKIQPQPVKGQEISQILKSSFIEDDDDDVFLLEKAKPIQKSQLKSPEISQILKSSFIEDDDDDVFLLEKAKPIQKSQLKSPEISQILKSSFIDDDDDDAFSLNKNHPVRAEKIEKRKSLKRLSCSDKQPWEEDSDFEESIILAKKPKIRRRNKFVLSQAEQTDDSISSGNEGNSLDDFYEASFIDDHNSSCISNNNKSMTSFYLKSVKPKNTQSHGRMNLTPQNYHSSSLLMNNDSSFDNVFSQSICRREMANEEYEKDSFIVGNESELQESFLPDGALTQVLKKAKENRRRKKENDCKKTKRRVVFLNEEEDDHFQ